MKLPVAVVAALTAALLAVPATASAAAPTCFGKRATIVGTKGADRLVGTDAADVIVGRGGKDVIKAGRGNDLICGDSGADRLYGGGGHDRIDGGFGTYVADQGPPTHGPDVLHDVIWPGSGNDVIRPGYDNRVVNARRDRIVYSDAPKAVTVDVARHQVTGHGRDRIVPRPGGKAAVVAYVGSRFADRMIGGAGRDDFDGGRGGDTLRGNGGADTLADGPSYYWSTDQDRDTLDGGAGHDTVYAGGGRDSLVGGDGSDALYDFGRSADRISAGPGSDRVEDYWVLSAGSAVSGGSGRDDVTLRPRLRSGDTARLTVDLRSGSSRLVGRTTVTARLSGVEDLTVRDMSLRFHGTGADDIVSNFGFGIRLVANGYAGDDVFFADGGNDVVDGAGGEDSAHVGGGQDRCVAIENAFDCESNG
ncbi:hypothetical protein [Nocardioides speluncae]|uniref:hypothetical protein n=1 Tax=Nocardioides speluncae TaxID=2670337 RepID=UPI000D6903D2|nr:hypothetical protein [Nocardioides speluncae]